MDFLLDKVTSQAMNYAIRSGLGLTAGYALRSANKLLTNAPKSSVRDELDRLQQRLQHKIKIISPAIDMIELIAARGNTSLETAISLTRELRQDIHSISTRLARAAATEGKVRRSLKVSSQTIAENELELKLIVAEMKQLLERIEDAVPLISLAITTSGVRLSPSLPHTISPSRLLQASTFLTAGDTQYAMSPRQAVQIGPSFTLTVYMLFAGYDRPQTEDDFRETTWKEVIHKARVKLRRVPLDVVAGTGSGSDAIPSTEIVSHSSEPSQADIPAEARSDEFAYQLMIIEDFDDDRMHDFEEDQAQPGPFDDVNLAGIREMVPVHEISKIFYADTSKVLNIGRDAESNHPVLLLKRDVNAILPRAMAERAVPDAANDASKNTQQENNHVGTDHTDRKLDPWRLPPSLDPEWMAFEVYTEAPSSSPSSPSISGDTSGLKPSPSLEDSISALNISPSKPSLPTTAPPPWVNSITTSLSLLELLLRLTSLQQFQQMPHLSITDELLNFFLEESASTGAGGDEGQRQAVRRDARRRVGWDPYDESPVKRRGEEYQYQTYQYDGQEGWNGGSPGGPGQYSPGGYGNGWSPSPQQQQQQGSQLLSPSPSPVPMPTQAEGNGKGRSEWLRRQGGTGAERKGSPLRPSTGMTDEGLGTSPASGLDRRDSEG